MADNENIDDDDVLSDIERLRNYLQARYQFRYNTISNVIECRRINGKGANKGFDKEPYEEMEEGPILFDINTQMKCDATKLGIVLSVIMERYNPFEKYFKELPAWDKENHIEKLAYNFTIKHSGIAGLNAVDNQLRFFMHLKKHLVRMVACAIDEKYINKQCFVLVGKQDDGKTYFNNWLCPPALADYIATNIGVDKDSQIALCENFIVNLDELAGYVKSDMNTMKSFFSMGKVKARAPYGRRAITRKRCANFIGNTNHTEFLVDATGSVRWVAFNIENIDFKYSKEIDINKVWAEAYALYKGKKFKYDLTDEEIKENEQFNNMHFVITAEMELIAKYFSPDGDDHFTTTDILETIISKSSIKQLTLKSVGAAMEKLGFKKESSYSPDEKMSLKKWKGRAV